MLTFTQWHGSYFRVDVLSGVSLVETEKQKNRKNEFTAVDRTKGIVLPVLFSVDVDEMCNLSLSNSLRWNITLSFF